jgi:hypothetical protein
MNMEEVMMDVDEQQIIPDPLPFARRLVILFILFFSVVFSKKSLSIHCNMVWIDDLSC